MLDVEQAQESFFRDSAEDSVPSLRRIVGQVSETFW